MSDDISYTYAPKELGLRFIGEANAGEMYEVNSFLVEYHADTGTFYWVSGSGCSCWEGYEIHGYGDFEGHGNAQAAQDALNEWAGPDDESWAPIRKAPSEIADLRASIAGVR